MKSSNPKLPLTGKMSDWYKDSKNFISGINTKIVSDPKLLAGLPNFNGPETLSLSKM